MSHSRKVLAATVVGALSLAALGAAALPAFAATTYTITVGSVVQQGLVNDTPTVSYIDKDGSWHANGAHSLYGSTDSRQWKWYSGTNYDDGADDSTLDNWVNQTNSNDKNNDTTWRCNNSPTGQVSTYATGTGYSERNYCDQTSTWIDPDTGDYYALVHNEFTPSPFNSGGFDHFDGIDLAKSTDGAKTWTFLGRVITSPYSTNRNDTTAFPNQTWAYGDGDPRLFVDTASGYFYVFYGTRVQSKDGGSGEAFLEHVARAPISGKMAVGTWKKWYNGAWNEDGAAGQESNMVPTSVNANGYTPVANDYKPSTTGTITQQIANSQMPGTSSLFVMDIAYDAYLGMYIGEPENTDHSGNGPQQFYATSDLATQKWSLIGDSGSYHNASWYRWFVDSGNKSISGSIVGKTLRSYCGIACSGSSGGEYVNLTIDSSAPASVVDTSKTYTIANGNGRLLAQASGSSASTSVASSSGSALENWSFTANGDGSYKIANASTGQALGVNAAANSGRAWGAAPTMASYSGSVGQQWWVIRAGSSFKIVNRYSGLVLGLSGSSGRFAETTPVRSWTDTSGNAVGGGRTAAEQTLTLTAVGTSPTPTPTPTPGPLVDGGIYTIGRSGTAQSIDDPNWSTTGGTQLVVWSSNSGNNQKWQAVANADGTFSLKNVHSNLCMDVNGVSTSAGAQIIQWSCNGGQNQEWTPTASGSGYTLVAKHSGLAISVGGSGDGSALTQQSTGTVFTFSKVG